MVSVELCNVSVFFPVFDASALSLKKKVIALSTGGRIGRDATDHVVVQALDSVDLSLKRGDRLALLGRNGAGKSTLLRVMAGIYEPTRGSTVQGRVAALQWYACAPLIWHRYRRYSRDSATGRGYRNRRCRLHREG